MDDRRLTNDGSYTLYSEQYGQTFHSIHGSNTESEHVFLKGAGIEQRMHAQQHISVLEVGFGTGLNFFLTANMALNHGIALEYWAYEMDLMPAEIISTLMYDELIDHKELWHQWLSWRSELPYHVPQGLLSWSPNDTLTLRLIIGDATKAQQTLPTMDAVYLDAFSPDCNPELWTIPFLTTLYRTLKHGGKLSTYSAKSLVRKNLVAAGFDVTKKPGPPGKREMLVGIKQDHM